MVKMYGIPNCDTVKKAQVFLKTNKIDFQFYNFKTDVLTDVKLKQWTKALGLEKLINKKSTTWKGLTEAEQTACNDLKTAIPILIGNSSLLKRPILETSNTIINAFAEQEWREVLNL